MLIWQCSPVSFPSYLSLFPKNLRTLQMGYSVRFVFQGGKAFQNPTSEPKKIHTSEFTY